MITYAGTEIYYYTIALSLLLIRACRNFEKN